MLSIEMMLAFHGRQTKDDDSLAACLPSSLLPIFPFKF
jgi:hypothetical protein